MNEKTAERNARRILARNGMSLHKSRNQHINADDLGGYRITDDRTNAIVAGPRFNLELDEVIEIVQNVK